MSATEELVVTHEVVEVPPSTRKRVASGAVLVLTGLVIFFGWGIGANNGEAAFQVSQFSDKFHVADLRYPGGGVAMVMGAVVVALGIWQIVRGFGKRARSWVVGIAVVFFILGFLSWAATGNPALPMSLPGLVGLSLTSSIPYILGALAGIVCERAGVINIAIEGQMLFGAFAAALVGSAAESAGWGIVAAVLAGALVGVLLAVFAIKFLVNQVVLGVVLNTLALGLTNLGYHSIMSSDQSSNTGIGLESHAIPLLSDIPVIGNALFNVNYIVYMTYALIVLVDVALFRTRWGLRSRAVGEHPKAADTVGIKVRATRYRNVLIGGLIAGLAGAMLTVGAAAPFNGGMTNGRGFIALACVIFGRWSPRGAIAAALLFGFTDQLQTTLTVVGTPITIPSAFLTMAPYLATVVAVAGFVGRVQAPAADGEPYVKG